MKYLSFSSRLAIVSALILESTSIAVLSTPNIGQTESLTRLETESPDGYRVEIAQYVPPTGIGRPPITAGGSTRTGSIRRGSTGSRADKCDGDPQNLSPFLTGLIPDLDPKDPEDNWGLTVEEKPQFFVYLPPTSAREAEFTLQDDEGNDVYRTKLSIVGESGIVRIALPKNIASLKTEQNYSWYFTIFCNVRDRRDNLAVAGGIRRIAVDGNLAEALPKAAERDRYKVYAENGIWYDAVAALAELRQENPNDAALAQEWKKLLESAGLKEIQDSPISSTALETSP